MPELPEVETIRCGLENNLPGKKITDVYCDSRRHLNMPFPTYRKKITGLRVAGVERRGKMLYLKLNKDSILAFHLKMTGQLIYRKNKEGSTLNKHTHLRYDFSDGSALYFNDLRRFGWAYLLSAEEFDDLLERMSFGPEPLTKEFSKDYLRKQCEKYPKRPIKQLLLDQHIIAGIGNIYADEVLFAVGIRPDRVCAKISKDEVSDLYEAIKKILRKAIRCGGSSTSDYLTSEGVPGSYGRHHKVYRRSGQECMRCGEVLQSKKVAGRTSTFCPRCQS